ncbi:hypothetical protein ACVI9W_000146 [Pseudomonas sp. 210_17 TE3656]
MLQLISAWMHSNVIAGQARSYRALWERACPAMTFYSANACNCSSSCTVNVTPWRTDNSRSR